jgi:hypothetical protein
MPVEGRDERRERFGRGGVEVEAHRPTVITIRPPKMVAMSDAVVAASLMRRNHFPNDLLVAVMRPMVGFAAQYSSSFFRLATNVSVSITGGSRLSL